MSEDISKNTIIVLVVLTVVISLLGTWTVINEVNKVKIASPHVFNQAGASGQIKLNILGPAAENKATGEVTLNKIQ